MTPILIDQNLSSEQILINEINYKNSTNLLYTDFDFNIPEPVSIFGKNVNTKVMITPKTSSPYTGTREIFYNRLDLGEILTNPVGQVFPENFTKLSEIIGKINTVFGINLKVDDYYDQNLPIYYTSPGGVIPRVNVTAKPESLLFTGSFSLVLGAIAPQAAISAFDLAYYIHNQGYDASSYMNSLISINKDGSTNIDFILFRNVTNIATLVIDKVLLLNNGELVLNGQFELTITEQGNPTPAPTICSSLVLRADGSVKETSQTPLFNANPAIKYTEDKAVEYKYVIDVTNMTKANRLYRYTQNGMLDSLYSATGVTYIPEIISLCSDGKLYTVSPIFTAPLVFNANIPSKQRRIDRLLSNGSVDPSFTSVTISAKGNDSPLAIVEIFPLTSDGFWMLFQPLYGVAITSTSPVINGISLVPGGINVAHAWNPVVKFAQNGQYDTSFKSLLKNNLDSSIFSIAGGNSLNVGDKVLSCSSTKACFFTMKSNPITGYEHRQPIAFNAAGELKTLSGDQYVQQYRWVEATQVIVQPNKYFLTYGKITTINPLGGYSTVSNAVARYKEDGSVDNVIYRQPVQDTNGGVFSIKEVLMYVK